MLCYTMLWYANKESSMLHVTNLLKFSQNAQLYKYFRVSNVIEDDIAIDRKTACFVTYLQSWLLDYVAIEVFLYRGIFQNPA